MKSVNLTAVYEPCEEGGYIAYIEEISGINSQGDSLEEAKENLTEALNLMFEESREIFQKSFAPKQKPIMQTLSFSL